MARLTIILLKRFSTLNLFERKLANSSIVKGDFLLYSLSQGTLYCGRYKLFGEQSFQFTHTGLSDWKHAR